MTLPGLLRRRRPRLSIVVVAFEMPRVLPRTLLSLSAQYQKGVTDNDYEVIVVDNGSSQPLSADETRGFGRNFHCHPVRNPSHSPAQAVNHGAARARGSLIAIMVDGARMLTPGFVCHALQAFDLFPEAVVAAPGWHLGPSQQQESIRQGYNEEEEDRLLESIGWPDNGYRLFEISSLAVASRDGCFLPLRECNSIVVSRLLFQRIAGYDQRFTSVGGGLVNHDFYRRALEHVSSRSVILPFEGSFHQLHGGISTNALDQKIWHERIEIWMEEYQRIRGEPYQSSRKKPTILGTPIPEAMPFIVDSACKALPGNSASTN